jgi:ABC-type transport system involved in multi-copper enzyme maturation permease subunit
MTLLPIVARELRVAARRRGTYWVRTAAALLVMVIGVWLYLLMQTEKPKDIAMVLFGVLTGIAVLHSWLSGIRATADCLSQEKRDGTLGLLFLTDLKGYDVVLGKLAASSLNSLYGVLAVVPMLAVPLLLGGITGDEFWRMALVALNTLFFSLTLGLCVSAMCRSARKAMGLTFLLLLCFTGVLPAAGALLMYKWQLAHSGLLFLPSAGFTYAMALDVLYRNPSNAKGFWLSLAVIQGLSWLWLAVAAFVAPRSWQDRPAGAKALRWRERWRLWSYGNLAERLAFRRSLLQRNAYFWLAARARLKPAYVWATFGVLGCGWLWGLARFRREEWLNEGTYAITALVLNGVLKCWFASETGRQLAEERQQGALELLLSTPLTVRDILRGQLLALQRQFLGPVLVALLVGLIFMVASVANTTDPDERAGFVALYTAGMLMLVLDLAGLYWTGMWQGLTSKNPNRATSAVVARILVLPWIAYALVGLVVSLAWSGQGRDPGWKFFLGLWVVLGLAADLGFGLWARSRLLTEFRAAAEQRYSARSGFWRRLLVGRETGAVEAPPVIGMQQ